MRAVPSLAVLTVLAVLATGCSREEEPYDDGSQAVPLAGLAAEIDDAGFEVVAADAPSAADPDAVVTALDDAGFDDSTTTPDVVDSDELPKVGGTAGLLGLVGPGGADSGSAIVLVFTSPSAAAVYAASDPSVLTDTVDEKDLVKLLSGNLVAFTPSASDGDLARAALRDLAGLPDATSSPS